MNRRRPKAPAAGARARLRCALTETLAALDAAPEGTLPSDLSWDVPGLTPEQSERARSPLGLALAAELRAAEAEERRLFPTDERADAHLVRDELWSALTRWIRYGFGLDEYIGRGERGFGAWVNERVADAIRRACAAAGVPEPRPEPAPVPAAADGPAPAAAEGGTPS